MAGNGLDGPGTVWHGRRGEARMGGARQVVVGNGMAWQAWRGNEAKGTTGHGPERLGKAGGARRGEARNGSEWQGVAYFHNKQGERK